MLSLKFSQWRCWWWLINKEKKKCPLLGGGGGVLCIQWPSGHFQLNECVSNPGFFPVAADLSIFSLKDDSLDTGRILFLHSGSDDRNRDLLPGDLCATAVHLICSWRFKEAYGVQNNFLTSPVQHICNISFCSRKYCIYRVNNTHTY